jgi:predicted TIM-barrel fold metal-dependent hydrolase
MPGIRLHPNYHGYKLDDPVFRELLSLAAKRNLFVQIALCMDDERTQHPLMRVAPVDFAPLPDIVKSEPRLRLAVLNIYPQLQIDKLRPLAQAGQVYFDFAMVERVGSIQRLMDQVTLPRVLFGSNYPLFYFDSALLKLRESGLSESQTSAICQQNAARLLSR